MNDIPYLPFLIISGVVALIATILIVSWYMEKKRTEAFAKLAESLNFEFLPKGDAALQRDFLDLPFDRIVFLLKSTKCSTLLGPWPRLLISSIPRRVVTVRLTSRPP